MKKRVFFTGATGFIGQCCAAELLRQGHKLVILSRRKEGEGTAEERVSRALAMADTVMQRPHNPSDYYARYRVVEGDLHHLPDPYQIGKVDSVFHAAGDPRFSRTNAKEIFVNNLEGTKNLLTVADRVGAEAFHYIGAAYAHDFIGISNTFEDAPCGCNGFINPYTESKCLAEEYVRRWGYRIGKRAFVYSPSIVIGHSQTGITTSFTGFARGMKSFFRLRQFATKKLRASMHEPINLPINVPGGIGATVNLVTIDYVVNIIGRLFHIGFPGTYHLTNATPPTAERMIQAGFPLLGITGLSIARPKSQTPIHLKPVEAILEKYLDEYIPFVSHDPHFSQKNVEFVLGRNWRHPRMSDQVIRRMFEFAIKCNFDKDVVYQKQHILHILFPEMEAVYV